MYFADVQPELTEEQQREFAAAERRLLLRLVIVGCLGLVLLGATLV